VDTPKVRIAEIKEIIVSYIVVAKRYLLDEKQANKPTSKKCPIQQIEKVSRPLVQKTNSKFEQ